MRGRRAVGISAGVDLATESFHDLGQRRDVGPRRSEVHDAGPQQVGLADDRIREEGLAPVIETLEDLPVELVQIGLRLRCAGLDAGRDVPKRRDAETRRPRLELGVAGREAMSSRASAMSSEIIRT